MSPVRCSARLRPGSGALHEACVFKSRDGRPPSPPPTCPGAHGADLYACSGHGMCVAGRCRCDANWLGDGCEVYACAGNCSSHGVCVHGECACTAGWAGLECQYNAACPNFCSLHGACVEGGADVSFRCECAAGWAAADCSVQLAARTGDARTGSTPSAASKRRVWRSLLPRGPAR